LVVADHGIPVGGTGRRNTDVVEYGGRVGHRLSPFNKKRMSGEPGEKLAAVLDRDARQIAGLLKSP
jgi:hypothetical protein